MHPIDAEAARLASAQHGTFAGRQLSTVATRQQIRRRARDGRFVDLGVDVFAMPGTPLTHLAMYKAAELSRPRAIVSGTAAATLHGINGNSIGAPEITLRPHSTHDHPFAVVHCRHDIRSQRIEGIRVTTVAQTIADLVGRLPVASVEDLVETTVLRGQTSLDALGDRARAMRRHHLPHRRVFTDLVEDRSRTLDLATSKLEVLAVDLLRSLDVPAWFAQYPLSWWLAGSGRADFAVPAWKVLIEVDGRRWHGRLAAFEDDRNRDQRAAMNGWIVLRFSWLQLVHDPSWVAEVILETGRRRATAA